MNQSNLDFSVSKRLNEFIDSLSENVHTIEIETVGNEIIVYYEDYEHEPVRNFHSVFQDYKLNEERGKAIGLKRKGYHHREETKRKISKSKSGVELSEYHKMKISDAKRRNNLNNVKNT